MSNRIKNNLKNLVGQTLNQYYSKVKPTISDLRYKQEYQNRIIECMVGEVDDNYITTPETDNPIVKLEHSKEGLVKVPTVKGKTILVDADGNETDTPAEGCRLVSVGESEDNKLIILSNNKNLIGNVLANSTYLYVEKPSIYMKYKDDKLIIDTSGFNNGSISNINTVAKFQNLKPNTTYTLSCNVKGLKEGRIYAFLIHSVYANNVDANGNWSYTFTTDENGFAYAVNNDKGRIRLNTTHGSFDDKVIISNIQLEEGSKTTNCVQNKSHKTEILLDEPLYEGNLIEGNKIVKNVARVIFDDNDKFALENSDGKSTYSIYLPKTSSSKLAKAKTGTQYNGNKGIKNNLNIPYGYHQGDYEHFYIENGLIRIYLSKERILFNNINDVKQYLKENNFIVEYELAEPIIEELPNGIAIQGFDDTTMYIENSITPTVQYGYNALIPYKNELSNQKEEVEINTLDIENNIIPYLLDMEFNLMTMEDNE